MKKTIILATLTLAPAAFGAEVDYSRCLPAVGIIGSTIDHDSKLQPLYGGKILSQKTERLVETYVMDISSVGFGGSYVLQGKTQEIKIERDDQNRIVKITTGGDFASNAALKMQKEMQLNSALMSGSMAT